MSKTSLATRQTCRYISNSLVKTQNSTNIPKPNHASRRYNSISSHKHPSLAGTHCLITGASRGIGRAIALAFASRGASCTITGREESTLLATISALNATTGSPNPEGPDAQVHSHNHIVGDISSPSFWKTLPTTLPSKLPPINVLVNAAGITHSSLLLRTTESSIEDIIQTNLMGTLWACRSVSKMMLKNKAVSETFTGKGCIINVASLLAIHGGAGAAAYVASKAGVVGLTRALAAELGGSGIRVNALLPGYVETDMTAAMSPESREAALSRIPLKRFGTAVEVADAAVFLALNAYANNCVLNLDGGLSASVSSSRRQERRFEVKR